MRRPTLTLAIVAALMSAACAALPGENPGSVDDTSASATDNATKDSAPNGSAPNGTAAADCADPCACAQRGTPDYSRENSGAPTATSDDVQRSVLQRVNHFRTAAGLPAFHGDTHLEQSSAAHAHYMASNPQVQCWPHVHDEVQDAACTGFTGADVGARVQASGYDWQRVSEVIDWEDSPQQAVDAWIWTVYHREPLLDWKLTDAGFTRAEGQFGSRQSQHNVMNFGVERSNTASVTAPSGPIVFPVPGQTNVPTAFRGDLESPTPPAPGGARTWPTGVSAGAVISMHFPSAEFHITDHQIFSSADSTCTEVTHTLASRENDPNLQRPVPSNDVFLYADEALEPGHEYVARVRGDFKGQPFERIWAFTTAAEQ